MASVALSSRAPRVAPPVTNLSEASRPAYCSKPCEPGGSFFGFGFAGAFVFCACAVVSQDSSAVAPHNNSAQHAPTMNRLERVNILVIINFLFSNRVCRLWGAGADRTRRRRQTNERNPKPLLACRACRSKLEMKICAAFVDRFFCPLDRAVRCSYAADVCGGCLAGRSKLHA